MHVKHVLIPAELTVHRGSYYSLKGAICQARILLFLHNFSLNGAGLFFCKFLYKSGAVCYNKVDYEL